VGLNIFSSGSTYDVSRSSYDKPPVIERIIEKVKTVLPGNPNPIKFEILGYTEIGKFLIAEVKYPGVTNYEGRKILVYCGITISDLREQGHADPHFASSDKYHSPVARFEPTARGWLWATDFAVNARGFEGK